jgi:hypothetical protein
VRLPRRTKRPDELAELAALADGSLPPDRRAELEARVAESPALAARLEQQRRVATAVQSVTVEAPPGLRARIEAERKTRTAGRRWVLFTGSGLATAAAAALFLLLVLPGNVGGGPSVAEAASLATRPPTSEGPSLKPGAPTLLESNVEGVPFPSWSAKFGWRTAGARSDRLDGRRALTVFYEKGGRRIGYTILSGSALEVPEQAERTRREGTALRTLRLDGRRIVTWLRDGHTCILSGSDVKHEVLVELAAWKGKGTVPF